jgi:hypothetical protein
MRPCELQNLRRIGDQGISGDEQKTTWHPGSWRLMTRRRSTLQAAGCRILRCRWPLLSRFLPALLRVGSPRVNANRVCVCSCSCDAARLRERAENVFMASWEGRCCPPTRLVRTDHRTPRYVGLAQFVFLFSFLIFSFHFFSVLNLNSFKFEQISN